MKRYVCLILAIVVAASIFAGCSKKNTAPDAASSSAQNSAAALAEITPSERCIQKYNSDR
jgi:outer membrane murein-binding lipoprotein Lpp